MDTVKNTEVPQEFKESLLKQPPGAVTSISEQIKEMDKLYASMEIGSASETVILAIDPIIERRLGMLLDKLTQCPAELGTILDIRAQICETWRIRKSLKE